LPDLIRNANELGYASILVSSNGFLLNDVYIKELIGCGVNGFHISLDGLRDTYNYVRGVDWFEKVLSAISSIVKAGIPVLVLTNLTRQVIDELEALVDLVHDLEKVISILSRIKKRYPSTCVLRDTDILYIKDYLYDPQRESEVPCSLGFRDIYLDPRGNVYSACMSMNAVGNVLDTPLVEIVQSRQMKSNLKAMLLRQCGGCTCGYSQRAELMHKKASHE
jgi:MoaA/NifB/PqqE/SkfB family radical SAM enzyme